MDQEAVMKSIRRSFALVALVLSLAPAGCTFGTMPREARGFAVSAVPPCIAGEVCAPFDAAPLWWAPLLQPAVIH